MNTRFDRDTGLEAHGDGTFSARIDPGWWIVAGPNGGYLTALLLRAMLLALDDPDRSPRSITVHFTERAAPGPARVETRLERSGRSLSTLSARLEQDGRTLALALAAFSLPRKGRSFQEARMPEVPPPERLAAPDPSETGASPFRQRFETRPAFADGAAESGAARTGGWIRLAEPRAADAVQVAAIADSWPPAVFSRLGHPAGSGGAPTIDLTVHFRAPLGPAEREPGAWLLGVWHTRTARDGFFEEDGEIWSRDGTLLAQSRQLAIFAREAKVP